MFQSSVISFNPNDFPFIRLRLHLLSAQAHHTSPISRISNAHTHKQARTLTQIQYGYSIEVFICKVNRIFNNGIFCWIISFRQPTIWVRFKFGLIYCSRLYRTVACDTNPPQNRRYTEKKYTETHTRTHTHTQKCTKNYQPPYIRNETLALSISIRCARNRNTPSTFSVIWGHRRAAGIGIPQRAPCLSVRVWTTEKKSLTDRRVKPSQNYRGPWIFSFFF